MFVRSLLLIVVCFTVAQSTSLLDNDDDLGETLFNKKEYIIQRKALDFDQILNFVYCDILDDYSR